MLDGVVETFSTTFVSLSVNIGSDFEHDKTANAASETTTVANPDSFITEFIVRSSNVSQKSDTAFAIIQRLLAIGVVVEELRQGNSHNVARNKAPSE